MRKEFYFPFHFEEGAKTGEKHIYILVFKKFLAWGILWIYEKQ